MTREKKFTSYKSSSSGFTLIEGAIAVAIASLLFAAGIDLISTSMSQNAIAQNQQRLTAIQQAILTYEATNSRLPCPASFIAQPSAIAAPYFGREVTYPYTGATPAIIQANFNAGCSTYTPDKINTFPGTGRHGSTDAYGGTIETGAIIFGAVPVRDLGLPDNYIADTYGYVYTYAVTQSATTTPLKTFAGAINIIDPTTGKTTLPKDPNGVAGTGTYVVVDHGKDGKGAYYYGSASTPSRSCTSTAGYDSTNCSFENTPAAPFAFNSAPFYASSGSSHFDDVIVHDGTTLSTSATCTSVYNAPTTAAASGTATGSYRAGLDVGEGADLGNTVIYLGNFHDTFFVSDFVYSGTIASNSVSPIVVAPCAAGSHVVSGGCTETQGPPALSGSKTFFTNIYTADFATTAGTMPSPCGGNSNAPCDTGDARQLITPPMSHPVYTTAPGSQGWECDGSSASGYYVQAYAICCTGSD